MKEVYTEEELQRFEAELRDKEEELRRKKEKLQEEQELLRERGRALEAQRREYQQVTCEIFTFVPYRRGNADLSRQTDYSWNQLRGGSAQSDHNLLPQADLLILTGMAPDQI